MKRITVTADIQVPRVPNFLLYDGGTIPVEDVSDADLQKIGEAWTAELIRHAQQRREASKQERQSQNTRPPLPHWPRTRVS